MAQGLEGAQIAAGAAAEIQQGEGRLAVDVPQQGGDVLADVVVAGAFAEGLGAVLVVLQGEAGWSSRGMVGVGGSLGGSFYAGVWGVGASLLANGVLPVVGGACAAERPLPNPLPEGRGDCSECSGISELAGNTDGPRLKPFLLSARTSPLSLWERVGVRGRRSSRTQLLPVGTVRQK
jgi:hypothetical protein